MRGGGWFRVPTCGGSGGATGCGSRLTLDAELAAGAALVMGIRSALTAASKGPDGQQWGKSRRKESRGYDILKTLLFPTVVYQSAVASGRRAGFFQFWFLAVGHSLWENATLVVMARALGDGDGRRQCGVDGGVDPDERGGL